MTGEIPKRKGNLHPNIAPYGEMFKTKDAKHITFAIGSNRHFEGLCECLELTLHEHPKFKINQLRVQNRTELQLLLQEKVEKLDSKYISKKLNQMKVPCAVVKNIKEVLEQDKAQRLIKTEKTQGEDTSRITSIGFELY